MIDIEERALGALEQDALACVTEVLQQLRDVCRNWRDDFRRGQRFIERFCEVHRLGAKVILQQEVMIVEHLTKLGGEFLANEQVGHTQCATRHLVLIRRADAAPRRSNRRGATSFLPGVVESHVRREDEWTPR